MFTPLEVDSPRTEEKMIRPLLSVMVLLALFGCGKSSEDNGKGKELVRKGLPGAALESGIRNTVWGIQPSSNAAEGIRFTSDGRYQAVVVQGVSGTLRNAMASRGTCTLKDDKIKLFRLATTCPALGGGRGDVNQLIQLLDENSLSVTKGSISAILKKFDPGPPPAVIVRWGCFNPDGSFVEHPWTDL
jgi:hypothetical protein